MPRTKAPLTKTTPVEELRNLSTLTAGWLRSHGITNYGELKKAAAQRKGTGLVDLWVSLRLEHAQVTRLMYFALWGALHDVHWNVMSIAAKSEFEAALVARGIAKR
jgi:hypothetical protein